MPCETAYFVDNEKYDMTLFFINFYICLIIIITTLIFANTVYNYYVYNNIVSDKVDNDTIVIENGAYPLKGTQLSTENKILIGETVDYKLFISLLLDQNMYYNDKYFTLNITNILLDVFMLVTIVLAIFSIIYGAISYAPDFAEVIRLKLEASELQEYIKQYCYFINNSSCDDYHKFKPILVAIVLLILIIIYFLRRTIIPSIYYPDYLDFDKSISESKYGKKNIENMLNIICDMEADFLNNDNNITKIIKKLNGHNIHTVGIVPSGDYDVNKAGLDKAKTALAAANAKIHQGATVARDDSAINVFITKIKIISNVIKDNKDNKDLDFVKLVIVYLNNKKIYNDNSRKEKIPNFDLGRTYAQSLLNIITNVIPYSDNLFRPFKTENYDIENILIGAIPVSDRGDANITDSSNACIIEYNDAEAFNANNEMPGCFYTNYLFKLKETSTKLKTALIVILILSIISIIAILVLFYYIYINYNVDNMKWANTASIKMIRLSWKNPLNWFTMLFGYIMLQLNNLK
jgi:hypothetical protein